MPAQFILAGMTNYRLKNYSNILLYKLGANFCMYPSTKITEMIIGKPHLK